MTKKVQIAAGVFILVLVVVIVFLVQGGMAKNGAVDGTSDPQKLMIPRWFLTSLTLDGTVIALPPNGQGVTLQFEAGGNANGTSGCNSFGGPYRATPDGKMNLGPLAATEMACETGMELERAYFEALSKVEKFNTENYKLTLSSADDQSVLIFSMPPK
jgi:heat shock protein HslJ